MVTAVSIITTITVFSLLCPLPCDNLTYSEDKLQRLRFQILSCNILWKTGQRN